MSLNDLSSSGANTQKESWFKNKFILSSFILIIIIIIIIISVIFSLNSSSDDKEPKKRIFGIIKCVYDIQTKTGIILGEEFKNEFDFDIFIDNEKIKFSKEYTFQKLGTHKIEYKIYEQNIRIDNMFKNIESLINVEISSDNQIIVQSMSNAFENCINLNKFESKNLNTSLVQSFHKLFYNSNLIVFNIDNSFNTSNAIDLSYMFSGSNIETFDLSLFQMNNVKNLSSFIQSPHFLESCQIFFLTVLL